VSRVEGSKVTEADVADRSIPQGGLPSASPGPRRSAGIGFPIVLLLTAASLLFTMHFVAYRVPIEATMGIVQKVFYFHAPAGYAMYIGATACFVGSCGFLVKGTPGWDALARAGADVAVAMGLILLASGALWAAKSWGVYWTWDPRLTTSLLIVLLYVAYVVLRSFAGNGDAERKFAAALGILGAALIPIIHFSVRLWGGTHPQVVTGKGGGLSHPDMKLGLLYGFIAFTLLSIALIWARARLALAAARVDEVEQEAVDLGILQD